MTFYEILEQVIALLQRHGRLSYRALKVQFELDDDRLDLLKEELIDIQHVARDQDARMLVWTGGTETPPVSASPPSVQQIITQQDFPTQVAVQPTAPHTSEAERRQLTVMFCDLVDSTALSGQLDPEDWRDVVRAYQRVCTEVIQRYDGYIAQYLGDGLLVYFGYPHAHEDDAHRAVRTGLGILDAMGDLNQGLQREKGIQLAVRVGIHTGLVVVGEMGGEGRYESLALGAVPNACSRIQGLAAPNTVAISATTYRLVQGYFECQELGEHMLRGVAEPIAVYRVLSESGVYSRLDVAQPRGLTPLVGREQEVGLLLERWEQAKAGQGQVVLLSGDAGIGKSRLVQMLKDHVANEPHIRWECRSSSYFENTALFPITDLFQRLLRFQAEDTPDEKLGKLEQTLRQYRLSLEDTVPLFAPLLALPVPENRYPPLNLSPQRQRQKTLETIIAILLEQAEQHPVLFIIEDLHWTDPTTLELIGLLLDQTPTASMLVLLTCRSHFQPVWHHRSYLTEMTVNRLSHTQVAQIITGITHGKTFPTEVVQQIIAKTDGVPLFVEEMTKAILESRHLTEVDGHYALTGALSTFAIPATLQDSLMARLDRLITAKGIAQLAAVIGRLFAYDLVSTVSQLDQATLQRELGRLVEAEIVFQRGLPPQSTYMFKHALIQDTAYQSLLKSTRQQYHQRIAQVLEEEFTETAQAQPELLAYHYTEAGRTEQAVGYWQQAGEKAMQRSAHTEAIRHLTKGIAVLETLPETRTHLQAELPLQIALASAFHASKGQVAREVEHAYVRAQALCEQVGDDRQLFRVLMGLYRCYGGRGQHQQAWEFVDALFEVAQRLQDPELLLEAHMARGTFLCHEGHLVVARKHLEQAITLYDPKHYRFSATHASIDPGVTARSRLSWTLWFLGYPEQARDRSQETLTLARDLGHDNSLAMVCNFAAILHLLRGEGTVVQEQVEVATKLAIEHDMHPRQRMAAMLQGWCLASHGQGTAGIAQMHQALIAYRATGTALYQVWFLALLAEAQGKHGQSAEGLEVLVEALALVRHDAGEHCWEPELHRLKGELLLQLSSDNQAEAEVCFHHAISIAQSQQAKSFELRAAISLACLWQQQGKRQEAHDLLAPVYNWFTEGFDTADLQDAKALLDELA